MSNLEDDTITVTIKYGGGFEAPWDVRRYPDQKTAEADLCAAYGIDPMDGSDWPTLLSEVVAKAQGIWAVKNELGATQVKRGGSTHPGWQAKKKPGSSGQPAQKAEGPSLEDKLVEDIGKLASLADAQAFGKQHKARLLKIEAAKEAFKKKMTELKEQA